MKHDPFYKRLLGHKRVVGDLVEAALGRGQGAAWLDALDFETLERQPTEGVTDDLRRRVQDMAWSVDQVGVSGGRRRLHLLLEHQSTVDHAMALRFLDYGSLLYQRLYGDDRRWREGEEVDAVECVVVYNGEREWTAATSLAGAGGAAGALDASYVVVDMARLAADDSFRGRALWWAARLESVELARLPELVGELGAWLASEGESELTRCLDLRVAQLADEWGLSLPSLARYEEEGVVFKERIDRWREELLREGEERGRAQGIEQGLAQAAVRETEVLQRGVEQGVEQGVEKGIERGLAQAVVREKALLRRQALRRFGATAAERLTAALDDVRDDDRLVLAGDWIVDSVDAEDFLARVARGAGG